MKPKLWNKNMVKTKLTAKQLSENRRLFENYVYGTDASYLIGKDYSIWDSQSKLQLHEMRKIPISKISKTSESLKNKKPVYKSLNTQAPPVSVTVLPDGTYRLFEGHRRLKTAKAQRKKHIFAEIFHCYEQIEFV